MRDAYNQAELVQLLNPAVTNADTNGDADVDMQGFEALELIAAVGASADTLNASNYIEFEVEHAEDDGNGSPVTWEDCADSDLLNTVTGTNTGTFAKIAAADEDDVVVATGYIGGRRHVRAVINFTGTHTTGTPIGVVARKSHARHQPAS